MCGKARVPGLTLKFGVVIFLRVFYDFAGIQGKQVSLPRKVIVLWGWGGGSTVRLKLDQVSYPM